MKPVFNGKCLDELSSQEFNDYQNLVNTSIAQLAREMNTSSPTRAQDAQIRLSRWEERLYDIEFFLHGRK
ncbi:hypothetical protein EA007_16815 [Vibrio anguillarum]|nr:hypothetical protein [Vibrio anguillarum]